MQAKSFLLILTFVALLLTFVFACGDSGRTAVDQTQVDRANSVQYRVSQTQDDLDRQRAKEAMLAQAQSNLSLHRNIWYRSGIRDYVYEFEEVCLPGGLCGKDIRSHVSNNVVETIVYADSGLIIYSNSNDGIYVHPDIANSVDSLLNISTIDGLFILIQRLISWKPDGIGVGYDAEFGYPRGFGVDHQVEAIDEEYGVIVLAFSPGKVKCVSKRYCIRI